MDFCPQYDAFLRPVRHSLAQRFVYMAQFCKHPPPKSVWNPDEKLNRGVIFKECFENYIITLKLMTVFINNTTYQLWFSILFACEISNTQSVKLASVTIVTTNSQGDWPQSTVTYMSTDRNWSPMLTSNLITTTKVTFHTGIWFHKPVWQAATNPGLCAHTFGLDIGIVGSISAWR